jgi:hypothetical protein
MVPSASLRWPGLISWKSGKKFEEVFSERPASLRGLTILNFRSKFDPTSLSDSLRTGD